MHPHRSKDAFFDLIDDWQGFLVSDGYGVYQTWVNRRQTCLAHLIRTARGLSETSNPELAACGMGAEGIAALVPYGQSAAHRWRVERLVRQVLPLDWSLP